MANENGPAPRCPECNHTGGHSDHCRAGIDESRPMTSAARYRSRELPGRADADIAPTQGERYFPIHQPLPDCAFCNAKEAEHHLGTCARPEVYSPLASASKLECDCGHGSQPGEQHLIGCPVEVEWAKAQTPDERSTAIAGVSGLDPIADARARASTEGLNPKDLVGAVKTPLGLLPWTALVQVAGVFAVGAEKYGAYNWRTKGQPVQHVTYVAAALRHLAAYMDGQTIDPETGCNHLAHAACGLLILLDASAVGNAIDNRPTPGNAAEIMALPSRAV